jgi:hypothetical protein
VAGSDGATVVESWWFEVGHVITYEEGGLRVAESWWDEIIIPTGVDLLRLLYRREAGG